MINIENILIKLNNPLEEELTPVEAAVGFYMDINKIANLYPIASYDIVTDTKFINLLNNPKFINFFNTLHLEHSKFLTNVSLFTKNVIKRDILSIFKNSIPIEVDKILASHQLLLQFKNHDSDFLKIENLNPIHTENNIQICHTDLNRILIEDDSVVYYEKKDRFFFFAGGDCVNMSKDYLFSILFQTIQSNTEIENRINFIQNKISLIRQQTVAKLFWVIVQQNENTQIDKIKSYLEYLNDKLNLKVNVHEALLSLNFFDNDQNTFFNLLYSKQNSVSHVPNIELPEF